MGAKLPQLQSPLESGLKRSAFLQTDAPIKHVLSEAYIAISLLGMDSGGVAHRMSLLPFRISAQPFRHAKTAAPFPSLAHKHRHSCSCEASEILVCFFPLCL